jgi:hypothetical protein
MKEIEIEWCPTKEMVANFMSNPLQGSHFRRLRDLIMGMPSIKKAKIPRKGMSSVKKAKIPRKSTVAVTKRDGGIKVKHMGDLSAQHFWRTVGTTLRGNLTLVSTT